MRLSSFEHIREVLDKVRYKQGWYLHVAQERGSIRPYLQWRFTGPCAVTGIVAEHPCRKWFLSTFMTDGELVQTAFGAALQAEEHECREFFLYDGHRIMNPHLSLAALVSRAHMTEGRA